MTPAVGASEPLGQMVPPALLLLLVGSGSALEISSVFSRHSTFSAAY